MHLAMHEEPEPAATFTTLRPGTVCRPPHFGSPARARFLTKFPRVHFGIFIDRHERLSIV